MRYRVITEDGREIKKFETERQAEKFWDNLNGVWTDYDNDDKEYYIYIEEIED